MECQCKPKQLRELAKEIKGCQCKSCKSDRLRELAEEIKSISDECPDVDVQVWHRIPILNPGGDRRECRIL